MAVKTELCFAPSVTSQLQYSIVRLDELKHLTDLNEQQDSTIFAVQHHCSYNVQKL